MPDGDGKEIKAWLDRSLGQTISARPTTWAEGDRVQESSAYDWAVVPRSTATPGGQAATCRASATINGKAWDGPWALRAQLLRTDESRAKRTRAVKMASIAEISKVDVLLRPWRTAVTDVPARALLRSGEGTETVALDLMPWAAEFHTAFAGLSGEARIERAIRLAIPLFSGLHALWHFDRVVHRDIHPDNVMVAPQGHLVLVDWGIASDVTDGSSTLTEAKGKWRTPYPAPESRNGERIGPETDAWALGVLLCEMACGEPGDPGHRGALHLPDSAAALPTRLREVIAGLTTIDRHDRMGLDEAVQALRAARRDDATLRSSANTKDARAVTTAPAVANSAPTDEATDSGARQAQATKLFAAGVRHSELRQHHDALDAYADVVEIGSGDAAPAMRQLMAMALTNTQWTRYQLAEHSEAIVIGAQVVDVFGHDADPLVRRQVAIGLNCSGYSKRALGQDESAISDWSEVDTRFRNDPDPVLRRQVASALRDKGLALLGLDRTRALLSFMQVIESFEHDLDSGTRRQVALALMNKRSCLYSMGNHEDALAECNRLVDLFGVTQDPVIRHQVAAALHSKGLILEVSQRREEAVAAYGRLVDVFANDVDPSIQSSVEWARGRLRVQ